VISGQLEKPMKIKFILCFIFFSGYVFSQDITLPEEKIIGRDRSINKTEIPIFQPLEPHPQFPDIPLLYPTGWKVEGKKEEKTKKEPYLLLKGGSFKSFDVDLFSYQNSKTNSYLFNFQNRYTKGYRENGGFNEQRMNFMYQTKKPFRKITFHILSKNMELPGPVLSPFSTRRDGIHIGSSYQLLSSQYPFSFEFRQNYYEVENYRTSFITLGFHAKSEKVTIKNYIERQDFLNNFHRHSFSSTLLYQKQNTSIGAGIKTIEGEGIRLLPFLQLSPLQNFHIEIKGIYETPDFWQDFLNVNYKELTKEKLPPVEHYSINVSAQIEKKNTSFKIGVSEIWHKRLYTWKDVDLNSLWQPVPEKNVWGTLVYFNLKRNFEKIGQVFLNGRMNFFDRDIEYIPESQMDCGIYSEKPSFKWKLWLSYTGKRKFSSGSLGGYSTLNSEFAWKIRKNIWLGFGALNLTGRKYGIVPQYPGEERKLFSYIKIYF